MPSSVMQSERPEHAPRPLAGVRVLEMGQLLAAPFASALLAWFGAEVIKIEPPRTGDPLRKWRKLHNGTALWWYALARNKKCITLNLKDPGGQEIVRRLVRQVDVVLENFKPGTLEKWGLGYEALKAINPQVIMTRVSGYGQDGPYAARPGFANVAEGFSGLRYVTGYPDRPPARPNLSLGDTLAGLHAALGILMALYHRDAKGTGQGQMVDVAIYEACFNLLESVIPEYDKLGVIRERQGSKISGIVPTATYPTSDGQYIIIGGNGDSIYKRLMLAAGREDLAHDPALAHNEGRVAREAEIDAAIEAWTRSHTYAELSAILEKAQVPAGPIYNAADMLNDPHYQARNLFEEVELSPGDTVKLPTFVPKLSETPGGTEWLGPTLGAHNQEVYGELLGLSAVEIERLHSNGVI